MTDPHPDVELSTEEINRLLTFYLSGLRSGAMTILCNHGVSEPAAAQISAMIAKAVANDPVNRDQTVAAIKHQHLSNQGVPCTGDCRGYSSATLSLTGFKSPTDGGSE